ncbi:hypothetical protein ACJX0J_041838, partial [Zea mays]
SHSVFKEHHGCHILHSSIGSKAKETMYAHQKKIWSGIFIIIWTGIYTQSTFFLDDVLDPKDGSIGQDDVQWLTPQNGKRMEDQDNTGMQLFAGWAGVLSHTPSPFLCPSHL